jgi:hypothetical protein
MSESKCRSGTKCATISKKEIVSNASNIVPARLEILQSKVKWGTAQKVWTDAAEADTTNLCVLKQASELSDEKGPCTGIADCKTGLLCDLGANVCIKNPGARVATSEDVSVTLWTTEAQIPTCQNDIECSPGTYCQMTQNPAVSVCAPASQDFVADKYGSCWVAEAMGSDGKSVVPRIDATKSSCKPNTAMTVDWARPTMDCRCCNMAADPAKRRCGEPSPMMKYGDVLVAGLKDASTMF